MKKQSFMTGTIILMIANAVSKILGAVLKVPLSYILHPEGMAIYNIAFEVYIMLLSFIISGFPLAISRLSADAAAKGFVGRERKIVTVSTIMLVCIGAAGCFAMYLGAPFFAAAMKERGAEYAIRMIAPSVFFVALGTGYKSYFQGTSKMIPIAISQVAESLIKLAAGYGLAALFIDRGMEMTAGGAIMGVTAGEIVATAILAIGYMAGKREAHIVQDRIGAREIAGDILKMALPLFCASVAASAVNVADTTLLRNRLLDGGLTEGNARFLYGAYTGYALTVFHLPVGILATLGVSILPVITGACATGNIKSAGRAADMGLRIAVSLSIPCAVIMYFMSGDILTLLFHDIAASYMLKAVAPAAVMLCAAQMSGAILQSAGKIMTPFYNSLFGAAVKLTTEYFLAAKPEINIYAGALGAVLGFTLTMTLNIISIRRELKLKISMVNIFLKPIICAAFMCLFHLAAGPFFENYNLYIRLICAGGISSAVYILSLMLSGAVSYKDIRRLCVGDKG